MVFELPKSHPGIHRYLGILSIVVLCYIALGSDDGSADILIDEPLIIDDTVKWSDTRVVVNSPIRIAEGGELLIDSCSIEFNGTYSLEVGITVEPFGRLEISGGRNGSVLGTGTSGMPYFLRAYPDSTVLVSNSTVSELGADVPIHSLWSKGNCIRSDGAIFRDCTFINCTIGIGLEVGRDSLIERSSFIGCLKGIVAYSVSNLSIINCDFTDCRDAIEAEKFYQSIGMSLAVSRTQFRNCSRSITFKGYDLSVNDCETIGAKRDIMVMWARRFSISDHNSSNTDVSLRFVGVDEGSIVRTRITNSTTGILARDSHLTVSTTMIDKVSTAFEIENSTVHMDGVAIIDSVIGIRYNDGEHRNDYNRSLSINGVLFDNISTPLSISEVSRVLVSDCVFKGHRPIITCTDIGEFRFSDVEAIVDGLTFRLSELQNGEVSMDEYSGVFLAFDLESTVLKYDCLDLDATVVVFHLDGISSVLSYIHPDELNITFIDRLSEFIWIKEVTFNIIKSSDGSPARGFETRFMDVDRSIILDARVGRSGVVKAGDVPILSMGHQQSDVQTPHTLEVSNNGTSHVFEVDLQLFTETHLVLTVSVDDVPPSIELTTPFDGGEYPGPVLPIIGHATDEDGSVQSVLITVDDESTFDVGPEWSLTVELGPGWHHLSVIATDDHLNVGRKETWFLVSVAAVSIEIFRPANGTITNRTLVTVDGRLSNGTWLTLNSEWVPLDPDGGFSIDYSLVEGTNRLQFEFQSGSSSMDHTILVIRDTQNPDVDLDGPPTITRDQNLILTGKVIDSNPPDSLRVGGDVVTLDDDQAFSVGIDLSEGPNPILIEIKDMAGNTLSRQISVLLDSNVTLILLEDPPSTTEQEYLTLRLKSEEVLDITAYANGATIGIYSFPKGIIEIVVGLELGSNSIRMVGKDSAGNTASINATVIREQRSDGPSDPISPQSWLVIAILALVFLPIAYIAWRRSTGARKS